MDEMLSFSQYVICLLFLTTLYLSTLLLAVNSFLVVSVSVFLFFHYAPPILLVSTHYVQQAQWQISPSAIWDQYRVSSTTAWPDILISVIQTMCYAFCPPTRQPAVYSPSE